MPAPLISAAAMAMLHQLAKEEAAKLGDQVVEKCHELAQTIEAVYEHVVTEQGNRVQPANDAAVRDDAEHSTIFKAISAVQKPQ